MKSNLKIIKLDNILIISRLKNFINKKIEPFKGNKKEKLDQKEFDLTNDDYALLEQFMLDETLDNFDNSSSNHDFFAIFKEKTSTKIDLISSIISDGLSTSKNKALQLKNTAIQFTFKSGETIKESTSKVFYQLGTVEKKNIFYKLINSIDLLLLIELLNGLKSKSKSNPKQLLAITGLITLLTYFNRQKSNKDAIEKFKEDEEVNNILTKIPLKDILSYADTVVIFLPPQFKVPAFVLIRILKMMV